MDLRGATLLLFCIAVLVKVGLHVRTKAEQRRKARSWNCMQPVYLPQDDPILGLDLVKKRNAAIKAHRYYLSNKLNHEKFGHTYGARPMCTTIISTIDLDNLRFMYGTNAFDWGIEPVRLFAFEPIAAWGIMTSDGHYWKTTRTLMKPLFSNGQPTDLPALERHVKKAITLIPRNGETIELHEVMNYLAFDSGTEMMFGKAMDSLDPAAVETRDLLKCFSRAKTEVFNRMMRPKVNALTPKPFWGWCQRAREYIDQETKRLWENRLDSKTKDRHVLGADLARRVSSFEDLRAQVTNLMFSAYDGTGASANNVFFHLARHPNVVKKLRQEILSLGPVELTAERLRDMEYLQWVINEAYRLTPPVAMGARTAVRDTYIPRGGGSDGSSPIFIAKGQTVFTPFFALTRRKDIFGEDADSFRPERWDKLDLPRWSFIPFGGGPRVCLGQQMVMAETAYIIVRFLQEFQSIENRDPVIDFVEHHQVTLISKNGVKAALIPA